MHSLFTIQLMLPRLIWQAQASHLQSSFRWSRIYEGFQNHRRGAQAKCLLWSKPGLVGAFAPINWSFFQSKWNRMERKGFCTLALFLEADFIHQALHFYWELQQRCSGRILEQTCMIQMGAFISGWLVLTEIKSARGWMNRKDGLRLTTTWDNGLVLGV